MNAPRNRRGRSVALLAAAALALTACSGMGGEQPPSRAAATNAECETVDSVTVVLQWVAQAQFAGYYAAQELGHYADACLEVTIQEGGTNVVPQQVLASGNAEFAVSHVVKSMVARNQGADIVNIGQVFERGGYLQVAWADSGIDSLEDLRGTRMGSWGGGNELVLYGALRDIGIEPTQEIEILQQPFDMSMLLNREVDSVQAKGYNELAQLLETADPATGELYTIDDFSIIDLQAEGYSVLEDSIYARESWLAQEGNEDIATRFLAATYKGWTECRDDADACVDLVLQQGSALGTSHQQWMMNEINALIWPSTNGIGRLDEAAWDRSIQFALDGGVLEAAPEGGYRTDLTEAALALVEADGVDISGADWQRAEVELVEGGR
ncbi:ABC transporter substrate-binding protein [Agrococcus sp. HG114]|uniref:ABC transporter substrate-binding protein n=1 Tax=Agrococcus sp. HG114 TaxID=2969757 RepID=UPI00215A8619|nr:ABC transporter substrate-binding protein [Agrococcus sp. HG114]MCR8669787.1 ABC transporter substrate-binding protein [Agrococcus sp. HG114]